jgi:hypothetical protein
MDSKVVIFSLLNTRLASLKAFFKQKSCQEVLPLKIEDLK